MDNELKPCPFCGGNDLAVESATPDWSVACLNPACPVKPDCWIGFSRKQAVEGWNTRALEAENAALLNQIQEIVRMAAEKNRPAYDEQQRVIMELREENAALKSSVLSEDEVAALERIELLMCKQLRMLGEITDLSETEKAGVMSAMESQRADLRSMRSLLKRAK